MTRRPASAAPAECNVLRYTPPVLHPGQVVTYYVTFPIAGPRASGRGIASPRRPRDAQAPRRVLVATPA